MNQFFYHFFSRLGLSETYAVLSSKTVLLIIIILVSFLSNWVTKKILLSVISKIVHKTVNKWDDILLERGIFSRLSHIVPVLVLYFSSPLIFQNSETIAPILQRFILASLIVVFLRVISSFISAINAIYSLYNISKTRPIKGYLQIVRVIVSILGMALVITTILNKSALGLISGIGALSAVLMLIFKDSILGLVAAVQLSGNDMIHIGDWISVPDYGADGDVIDIKLQTVTIQNFDKTLVNVPIYSLISSSFKNWRGMSDSGGRRIKRHLNIDMNSVKFCSDEMVARFKKIERLGSFISEKEKEISEDNRGKNIDTTLPINGRRMTNLGVFRAYIALYLQDHSKISNNMTFLVRQLQPSDKGIPLEIYVFSIDQNWNHYESIQADIFDHLLACISFFDLAVYQTPSSLDFRTSFKSS
ncbi:MAG: mechanosensitive ion channel [Spirochaetaceae bacterium]|nr:mechanosensitive ion channel [Spirochaetaceae bacterium]